MYLQHFGLAQYPFSLSPNTRYFLKLPSHQQAFNTLLRSLQADGAYTKITGEIGTGKTMLCRMSLNAIEQHKTKYKTAFIPNPILDEVSVLQAIADDLEISLDPSLNYPDSLRIVSKSIIENAERGRMLVIFIDESQVMPEDSLRSVHLLSKLNSKKKILHFVLFGQPELDQILASSNLAEIQRGIVSSIVLPALDQARLELYVNHRLSKAGYSGNGLFTTKALTGLYEGSQGVPRLINILAHKAIMVCYGKGEYNVSHDHVAAAIADTESSNKPAGLLDRFSKL